MRRVEAGPPYCTHSRTRTWEAIGETASTRLNSAVAVAVVEELQAIRARLAELEAAIGLKSPILTQERDGDLVNSMITLKRAAGLWGISDEGARKRCIQLAGIGLAEKRRPGGWRVSLAGLRYGVARCRG